MEVMLLIVLLITTGLYLIKVHYQYWKKRNVPGPKPTFLIGNFGASLMKKKSLHEIYTEIYNEYKNFPLVGIFRMTTPVLVIRDPELIREMVVKSFDHFHDNDLYINKERDPIFGRNPAFLKGEEWKSARSQLTPGFTSGKMKWLYPFLKTTAEQMVNFLEKRPEIQNGYSAEELCTRFTLNNVASCAFGLEGKCFEEDNSEFRQIAKEFLTTGTGQSLIIFVGFFFPMLLKLLPIKMVPKSVEDRLMNIVTQTLKYREENNVVRNDFLHILHQLKKASPDGEFTDVDVTAHAAGFFVDGYVTSASAMSFLLYELAANPESQAKLREEVNQQFQENKNELPYEVVQALPYLDACLNESLRKHVPIVGLPKSCTKPYTYVPKDNEGLSKPIVVEKDTTIFIPTYCIHHDPEYFEEPESFKPERFLDENKENIKKYTFMPFGAGPRSCLGQRFAILQMKVGVVYLVHNYQLSVNKKTKVPIKYDPVNILTTAIGGLWLDFKKIT